MKNIIAIIASIITFIPIIIIGLIWMSFNLLFTEIIFIIAKIWDWAKRPEIALEYLKLLENKRRR